MTNNPHKRRPRRSQRLFDFDRGLDHRYVAGADEAGRGCLAGPLVSAAVLFDYERLSISDRRILGGIHDSKQMTEEARLEMYPCVLRAAARTSIVIRSAPGIDRRGLHVTNCEALGDALARPGPPRAGAPRRSAWSTASACRAARSRTGG